MTVENLTETANATIQAKAVTMTPTDPAGPDEAWVMVTKGGKPAYAIPAAAFDAGYEATGTEGEFKRRAPQPA